MQRVQRSHWKTGDALHLETFSLQSQTWLPIAFCPKDSAYVLELIFLRPYVEEKGSCQVLGCVRTDAGSEAGWDEFSERAGRK